MNGLSNTSYDKEDNLEKKHLDSWISSYAKKIGIDIIFENESEHIAYIDTSDLNNPKIFLNLKNIIEKYNFSKKEILFIIFHEIEHLREEIDLKTSKNGQLIFEERNKKFKEYGNQAKSFHMLENIFRDIFVNNQVIHPKNAPVLTGTINSIYGKKAFKENNYLSYEVKGEDGNIIRKKLPKHLQFIYTLFREKMLPNEKCIVEDDVRKIINKLKNNGILDITINGNFKDRLENIWKYIEPIYKKFLENDYKELEEQKEENKELEEEKGEGDGEMEGQKGEGDGGKEEEKGEEDGEKEGQKGEEDGEKEGQKGEGDGEMEEEKGEGDGELEEEKGEGDGEKEGQKGEEEGEGVGPFNKYYKEEKSLPHIIEDSIGKENLEEELKQIIDKQIENKKPKSKEEMELERRVKNMLDKDSEEEFIEIKEKLEIYDLYLKKIKKIKDNETKKSVIEEITHLFKKIKSRRLKPSYKNKGAVDIELGVRLDPSSIADGIGQIKSGNTNPEMFEQDIFVVKNKDFVGKFDLTIVADGSGSMKGQKNIEQKKAVLLIFEALKKLNDKIKYSNKNFIKSLEFTTEGIIFKGSSVSKIKEKSNDFTDKNRLLSFGELDYYNGNSTNDYDAIDKIIEDINNQTEEYKNQVKKGKIKKIIIVMSDGGSSNSEIMKKNIEILRKKGVLVYGIGITSSGSSVIELYEAEDKKLGFGQVCEKSEYLAKVLKNLLKKHLEII